MSVQLHDLSAVALESIVRKGDDPGWVAAAREHLADRLVGGSVPQQIADEAKAALKRLADNPPEVDTRKLHLKVKELAALRAAPALDPDGHARKEELEAELKDHLDTVGQPDPEPIPDPRDSIDKLMGAGERVGERRTRMEALGYNQLRQDVMKALGGITMIPVETFDEAIEFNRSVVAQLRLADGVDPNMLRMAIREGRYLDFARRQRHAAEELEQRIAAGELLQP